MLIYNFNAKTPTHTHRTLELWGCVYHLVRGMEELENTGGTKLGPRASRNNNGYLRKRTEQQTERKKAHTEHPGTPLGVEAYFCTRITTSRRVVGMPPRRAVDMVESTRIAAADTH